jgi:flagellar biogenesis protein FliO
VPSHFSSNGSITSEVDKAQLINTYMGVVFGLGSLFFCMAFFLPACFSCVSLPDAQYHLSTARRAYTLAAIGKMFLCQGSLTIVFAAVTYQLQFAAADSARDSIDAGFFWLAFFAYLVAIIATVVFLVKRFNKVKRAHQLYQRSLTPLGESR